MAYTNPSTFVAGNVLTAAQLNANLRDNMRFFHGVPTASVRRAAAQSIGSGAWTALQFDTEDWDTNTIWSSTSNERFFARTAGKYAAVFGGGFAGTTGGTERGAAIIKNTTTLAAGSTGKTTVYTFDPVANNPSMSVSYLFSMTTSDFLVALLFQNSGSAMNTNTDRVNQPSLQILWVSS